jgi:hypothetical protein
MYLETCFYCPIQYDSAEDSYFLAKLEGFMAKNGSGAGEVLRYIYFNTLFMKSRKKLMTLGDISKTSR